MARRILVTGGAGFIGSALVRFLIEQTDDRVCNVDKLTYAGNLESLASVTGHPRYAFERRDIGDPAAMAAVLQAFRPDAVMHLAAESHVDRSISGPEAFIATNVQGTLTLLEAVRHYWLALEPSARDGFRFHHVSTDEVYGSLGATGFFTETSPYDPSSPYSASKAASDHLVRAWHRTYGLPVVLSNCSNNYGPCQFPEKLIPLMILNAVEGRALPVYGDGQNVRDWLYVEDHVRALYRVLSRGAVGETYNIGGCNERTNLQVVHQVCDVLEALRPGPRPYRDLITPVADRPGHDRRYAIDAGRIRRELDWEPVESFETGLRKTVQWYLDHGDWCRHVQDGSYQRQRLGLLSS